MNHNIKPGVATGDQVQAILKLAKEKKFALPAVNVVGSSSINGVLETAKKLNSPVIIQSLMVVLASMLVKDFQMNHKKVLLQVL